jgi:hypothetical protein
MKALFGVYSVGELVSIEKYVFRQKVKQCRSVLGYLCQIEVENCLEQFIWTKTMTEQYFSDQSVNI